MMNQQPCTAWNQSPIRVFISHVDQFKFDALRIKSALADMKIASFVAHEDIEPSEDWQSEITRALSTMNMFVALLTQGFHESYWTDQEIGFALARRTPILPVNFGLVPYGFIGKIQALRWNGQTSTPIAHKVFEMALDNPKLRETAKDTYISAVANALGFNHANSLVPFLFKIDCFSENQEATFVDAYNSNDQVFQAFEFRKQVTDQLERLTGNPYIIDMSNKLCKLDEFEDIPF